MRGYMKFKFTLLAAIFAMCLSNLAFAQNQNLSKEDEMEVERLKAKHKSGFFGFSFTNSIPQNEFFDNVRKSGPGFSVYGGYNFESIPISIGAKGDFLFYGGDERVFTRRNSGGWVVGRDTVDYQNMVIPITVFAKIQPNLGNFAFPYFEAFAGFTMLSASADYKSSYWGVDDSKNELDASWNYGVGVGTMIKLVDFVNLPDQSSRMMLDVGFRYMNGTETDYYKINYINNDTSPEFESTRSRTDMILFQLGIVFEF